MKFNNFLYLSGFGLKTIFHKLKNPILGTIILTDYCNLSCKHCAVNNINKIMYPFDDIVDEMYKMYNEGIRILFFCGGETLLWEDNDKCIRDLIVKAKQIGFFIVNIVTNGTIDLNIPEADIIFLSLDGIKNNHNLIRGDTFDKIMDNVSKAPNSNICVYMAVNNMNYMDIREVTKLVRDNPNLNSISFNLHTPYKGTEKLALTKEQKIYIAKVIKNMIKEKYPIFNLASALDYYIENKWDKPCYQCVVSENKKRYVCGRCVEIDGLCDECGYLFAVEFSLLCKGKVKVILDMFRTYLKYV
ncbi:metallo cofactor biosynthesis protein [Clostridium botulinum]|uniref:Metallo cofactor biosynthesis protein n=1 Tax=Clostridium botulinum TaxID=1491 RepID=A0A9Q1UW47_CLOBO|nr:radical SAM protein [Clostridium botulinum]KEI03130.1 metallo cofactor biosynthesis protein [Clostridium botulinum C/D str. Sp77]KOA79191.1 metallo cofactor biosynthesis protein [Clostridium botulinum]KOA81451.1 metallo cofactor biosynthesis protein [Clostridium botulinum]KOA82046.1 metallo cofactor biosynthesis protein [Clostridium botulinum]KOA83825.1 metallo cofactor biosynthesis protein [Clostridium botulinum]